MTKDEKAFLKRSIQAGSNITSPVLSIQGGYTTLRKQPTRKTSTTDSLQIWEGALIIGLFMALWAIQLIFTA